MVSVSPADLIDVVAQASDLSEGGIRFMLDGVELEIGDVVRITLELSGRQTAAVGQVVRATDCGDLRQDVAMAFLEIDEESLVLMREQLDDVDLDAAIP